MPAIEYWCRSQQIDCLYFLADVSDRETIRLAEDHYFRLVDIRATFEIRLPASLQPSCKPGMIRLWRPDDLPELKGIARASHVDSRFYFDSNFPPAARKALYETWIEKSCHGYADVVFVAELNSRPSGYISCHLRSHGTGQIGLTGVAAHARGQGLGRQLVLAALRWFAASQVKAVSVVTQGRNVRAQRLYQRFGFTTHSIQLWYHRWFQPKTIH
jgi:dTDP-4-amino-4,6-dideoxy-D-galactose acyltransferase